MTVDVQWASTVETALKSVALDSRHGRVQQGHPPSQRHDHVESAMRWGVARPFRRAGRGNPPAERLTGRPGPTPTPTSGARQHGPRPCSSSTSSPSESWPDAATGNGIGLVLTPLGMAIGNATDRHPVDAE